MFEVHIVGVDLQAISRVLVLVLDREPILSISNHINFYKPIRIIPNILIFPKAIQKKFKRFSRQSIHVLKQESSSGQTNLLFGQINSFIAKISRSPYQSNKNFIFFYQVGF